MVLIVIERARTKGRSNATMAHSIPQINIQDVLADTLDPVQHPQREPVVSREPGTAAAPITPSSGSRVGRMARKPLSVIRKGLRMRGGVSNGGGGSGEGAVQARERALQARGRTRPGEGEEKVAVVRVRVVRCEGLVVRDRKSSDP